MSTAVGLLIAAAYVLIGRFLLMSRFRGRDAAFAVLNLAAVHTFFFRSKFEYGTIPGLLNVFFAGYILVVSVQYLVLRRWCTRPGVLTSVAFFLPIAVLVFARYAPIVSMAGLVSPKIQQVLIRHPELSLGWILVGISYLSFRTSFLVIEVRNEVVPIPTYWEYLGFAFFAPTMWVGPISPYALHRSGIGDADDRPKIDLAVAALRVIVGAVKFRFFAPMLNQLTYSGLLLDGHPHHWLDLPIAVVAYYLFLYCNFSGFCDIAIGGAGLMGIPVAENFDSPLAARNIRDFWNRWHMTLSAYMRDVLFSPLSKSLVRTLGSKNVDHAIALTIFVVFLLIGLWHGSAWHYAAFGFVNALGVIATHYYTIALKKRLGKDGFARYNRSRLIRGLAIAATFAYVSACMFLFANDAKDMRNIIVAIWG